MSTTVNSAIVVFRVVRACRGLLRLCRLARLRLSRWSVSVYRSIGIRSSTVVRKTKNEIFFSFLVFMLYLCPDDSVLIRAFSGWLSRFNALILVFDIPLFMTVISSFSFP